MSFLSKVWYKLLGLTCVCFGGGVSDGTLWRLVVGVTTLQSRSTAEIREHESDRLPFLSKRALKLSLLDDLWVLNATGRVKREPGSAGVTGREQEQEEDVMQCLSSSESLLLSIFLLDLRQTEKDHTFLFRFVKP